MAAWGSLLWWSWMPLEMFPQRVNLPVSSLWILLAVDSGVLFKRCIFRNETQDLSSDIGHHINTLLRLLWAPPGLWSDSLLCLNVRKCLACALCCISYFMGFFFLLATREPQWRWHFADKGCSIGMSGSAQWWGLWQVWWYCFCFLGTSHSALALCGSSAGRCLTEVLVSSVVFSEQQH